MCSGREFQVDGAETEKARDEKLLPGDDAEFVGDAAVNGHAMFVQLQLWLQLMTVRYYTAES